jgi:hypothetical protein
MTALYFTKCGRYGVAWDYEADGWCVYYYQNGLPVREVCCCASKEEAILRADDHAAEFVEFKQLMENY